MVERMNICFTRDGLVPTPPSESVVSFWLSFDQLRKAAWDTRLTPGCFVITQDTTPRGWSFFSGRKDFVSAGHSHHSAAKGYQHWALRAPQQPKQVLARELKGFWGGESMRSCVGPHLNNHLPHERGIDCLHWSDKQVREQRHDEVWASWAV